MGLMGILLGLRGTIPQGWGDRYLLLSLPSVTLYIQNLQSLPILVPHHPPVPLPLRMVIEGLSPVGMAGFQII